MTTFSTLSWSTPIALNPSLIGLRRSRPRFFAIAASKPVSITNGPPGPRIAHTK
jgi:hypothetical protein